ncbi:GbsR/MarR family transcriptional regulator [Streptomyces sp. CBMA123]|uniref:GbsR/MarR family transcriptional regulator n=1 Tax=Streptomyces sp. CBMA123 TaxID=1896313 RepID=UPI00294FF533|nr:MarR family transcriptional regulator [Streptomyces sp. CBMA123]
MEQTPRKAREQAPKSAPEQAAQGAPWHGRERAVSDFVERFAAELVVAGMGRMPSRIFSCLMAEESGVLTSAELSERLQISPAAVSGGMRYLIQVGLVAKEREPGSRRDRYRVLNDVWFESLTRRDELLLRWVRVLKEGELAVGVGTVAAERLAESAAFFEFMIDELHGMLGRWREHRAGLTTGK